MYFPIGLEIIYWSYEYEDANRLCHVCQLDLVNALTCENVGHAG